MDDTYTRQMLIGGERHLVSFLPYLQKIVFTNLDKSTGGDFDVINGHICSNKPHDFILADEVCAHLQIELSYQEGI